MNRVMRNGETDPRAARVAGCTGKFAFPSPQAAARVRRGRKNLIKAGVYHCRACGKYHIGTDFRPGARP